MPYWESNCIIVGREGRFKYYVRLANGPIHGAHRKQMRKIIQLDIIPLEREEGPGNVEDEEPIDANDEDAWHEEGDNDGNSMTETGTNQGETNDRLTDGTLSDPENEVRIDLTDDEADDPTPEDTPLELISEGENS